MQASNLSSSNLQFDSPALKWGGQPKTNAGTVTTSYEMCYAESLTFNHTSKDGDKLHLQYDAEFYKNLQYSDVRKPGPDTVVQIPENDDGQNFRDELKADLLKYRDALLKAFFEQNGIEYKSTFDEVEEVDKGNELQISEYWNVENTSQRIVDFALSFRGVFEGSDQEFLDIIKGAVDEGFKQAKELFGTMPEPVQNLYDETYNLTIKKLDDWAAGVRIQQKAA